VGEDIPLVARIVRACDAFSAMTTDRSYRKARPVDEAVAELERCSGTDFDPVVVEALAAGARRDQRQLSERSTASASGGPLPNLDASVIGR
jgi:HD-GYP domain-containing protein (c-di-GMP phosphodiesterase class II)